MKKYLYFLFVLIFILLVLLCDNRTFDNVISCIGIACSNDYQGAVGISPNNVDELLNKLDVKVVSKFKVSERLIIEGYTTKIANYIVIDGRKINVQISVSDDVALVGSPLIDGSF